MSNIRQPIDKSVIMLLTREIKVGDGIWLKDGDTLKGVSVISRPHTSYFLNTSGSVKKSTKNVTSDN